MNQITQPRESPADSTRANAALASRYAHWITATLMLCSLPMGLFLSVLPDASQDRAEFLAAHQSMGLTLLIVVVVRIMILLISPPPGPRADSRPWERSLAGAMHAGLYGLIIGFPLSGVLMTAYLGEGIQFYGWRLDRLATPDPGHAAVWAMIHGWLLPVCFYAVILAHVGAVLKHHFADGRRCDVRRMLT